MIRKAVLLAIAACHTLALAQEVTISREDRLKVFDKTWETVNKKFYDPKFNGVDWPAMKLTYRPLAEAAADKIELRAVLNRMVSELHVSHVGVSNGLWFSTGISYVRLGPQGEQWVIGRAYSGSPAKDAGIERGWLSMGGSGDCNALGRRVTNTFRDKQGQDHKTDVPCAFIRGSGDAETPTSRMLNDSTIYLRLPQFSNKFASWFVNEVNAHRSASTLVIDLRGNDGGSANALTDCLKVLLPSNVEIARASGRNGERTTKAGDRNAYNGRVFVLTNRETGSAAEVFAAAIQEAGRGVIVGRTTEGAVMGAKSFSISNGFQLHLALYDIHTAKGTRLEGRGVIPDEPVELTLKDYRENKDPDLGRVLAILAAKP